MKKIIEHIVAAIAFLTMFLFGAEAPAGEETAQNLWWLGCVGVLIACGVVELLLHGGEIDFDDDKKHNT